MLWLFCRMTREVLEKVKGTLRLRAGLGRRICAHARQLQGNGRCLLLAQRSLRLLRQLQQVLFSL